MKKICFFVAVLLTALAGNINAQTDYGIEIAGIAVTSANCTNITGANISGSVSYNDATKTLTLDNATIDGNIGFDVEQVSDITITLVGENTMTDYIGNVRGTKTINGSGSLNTPWIECFNEQNTIIENCTINIDATPNDWEWAMDGGNSKITIKNANLSSEAMEVAIGGFADIELIGCEIVEPVNAQIIDNEFAGDNGKYICNEDGTIAKKVVIKKLSGLNDIVQNNSISIYPNPASDFVTIEGKGEVVITNSLGQVVKHIKDNNDVRTLNIENLPNGVYCIKVGEKTQKLVVE